MKPPVAKFYKTTIYKLLLSDSLSQNLFTMAESLEEAHESFQEEIDKHKSDWTMGEVTECSGKEQVVVDQPWHELGIEDGTNED